MTKLIKTEERYYDTFEIVRSGDNGDRGLLNKIRVIPFADRWRTPEETVAYLQGICNLIKKNFMEKK